jgi:hypothetical protein
MVLGRYNSREDVNITRTGYNFTLYDIAYSAWNVCCVNHKIYLTSVWKIACRSKCSLNYSPDISIFTYLEENHMWSFPGYVIPEPNLNSHFFLRNSCSALGHYYLFYGMTIFAFKQRCVIEAFRSTTKRKLWLLQWDVVQIPNLTCRSNHFDWSTDFLFKNCMIRQ